MSPAFFAKPCKEKENEAGRLLHRHFYLVLIPNQGLLHSQQYQPRRLIWLTLVSFAGIITWMPVNSKKISRREQIITEASALFREKGYNASSMRMLADRIGMEAASLYNHIKSKEELLKEICFSVAKRYLDHLSQLEESKAAPQEKVKEIIRFQLEIMMDSYELVYVSQRDWKHLGDPWLSEFLEKRRHYEKRFAAIISQGIEQAVFRKMEPYVAVLGILAAIRAVEYWQRQPKNISAAVFKTDLLDMLMAGLLQ